MIKTIFFGKKSYILKMVQLEKLLKARHSVSHSLEMLCVVNIAQHTLNLKNEPLNHNFNTWI